MTESVSPSAVYSTREERVLLRIATGGSGQSGLLEALAKEFVQHCIDSKGVEPFLVEWYKSDTTFSIENLRKEIADVAITYHAVAERTALDDNVVDRVVYAWRDHWLLIGPKSNPARLPEGSQTSVFSLFTRLFSQMEEKKLSPTPIKFLSRYDKSAGNIVESLLWATIGQVPWADPPSSWYHMFPGFPFQAIREAADRGEYTVTDKGTWLAIEDETRKKLTIFAEGKDDENDVLLNPAHVLVGKNAKNKETANDFADWIIRDDGGQRVIRSFTKNGEVLYSTIPVGVDPLDRIKGVLGVSGITPPQLESFGSNKAAVPLSWSRDEIYFFKDQQYVRINTVWDTIDKNAKDVWSMWPALKDLGFAPINAIFSAPENKIEAYFFSGSRCARLNTQSGQLADKGGPFNFQEKWSCLKDAGLDIVDAAMPFAFKGGESASVICFFRKETYALVDVNRDFLVESGNIALRFNALARANFKTIDVVVFKPRRGEREAYFFSGSQYVLVDLIADKIAWGPLKVGATWKSLKTAGFF